MSLLCSAEQDSPPVVQTGFWWSARSCRLPPLARDTVSPGSCGSARFRRKTKTRFGPHFQYHRVLMTYPLPTRCCAPRGLVPSTTASHRSPCRITATPRAAHPLPSSRLHAHHHPSSRSHEHGGGCCDGEVGAHDAADTSGDAEGDTVGACTQRHVETDSSWLMSAALMGGACTTPLTPTQPRRSLARLEAHRLWLQP